VEQEADERPRDVSEGALAVGGPEVHRVADGLLGAVVKVVAEGRPPGT
jgi:hypothetical protein